MSIVDRPRARLKIGKRYIGKKASFTAQGYVVFKEWDPEDRKFYYWEEWELTGFDNYDSWIEYDHYSKKITMYQPMRAVEKYDVLQLAKGSEITLTSDGQPPVTGIVDEMGTGTVARLEGKMSYQLFSDDKIHYAEVKTGPGSVVSIEDYRQIGDTDYDYYAGRILSSKDQKEMFGKEIAPFSFAGSGVVVTIIILAILFLLPIIFPQYETTCTPRSTVSPDTTGAISDTTAQQDCKRVRVYGGGGGGVGK